MAFGQPAGPPASRRQLEALASLLERAGFESFKEARHPLGLSQRQAGGRFTSGEAEELIERLGAAEVVAESASPTATSQEGEPSDVQAASPRRARSDSSAPRRRTLSSVEDEVLVRELERRGWCCIPPVEQID